MKRLPWRFRGQLQVELNAETEDDWSSTLGKGRARSPSPQPDSDDATGRFIPFLRRRKSMNERRKKLALYRAESQ